MKGMTLPIQTGRARRTFHIGMPTMSRSISQSSSLDIHPTAAAKVHCRRLVMGPQRTPNSEPVSSIQIQPLTSSTLDSATHILDLRAADRRQRQHRAISQTLKMITRLRGQPSQSPDRRGMTARVLLSPPHSCRADPGRTALRKRAA